MKTMIFAAPSGERRVRDACFEERSLVPPAAVCLVASSVREILGASLGAPITLHLFEPRIPSVSGWRAIERDALLYRVRANAANAAIVFRPADAVAVASAAFGERAHCVERGCIRDLSSIERELLERTAAAIAASLGPVCGQREGDKLERIDSLGDFSTYFELLLERPIEARIGIALSREPRSEGPGRLAPRDLEAIELPLEVRLDLGGAAAGEVAALAPGCVVPIMGSRAFRGSLLAAGRTLALGTCGVRNGRYAFAIEEEQIR